MVVKYDSYISASCDIGRSPKQLSREFWREISSRNVSLIDILGNELFALLANATSTKRKHTANLSPSQL